MIRYNITNDELRSRITDKKSDWLSRAKKKTSQLRQLKKYEDLGSIWSEIKEVYMNLQHCKCVFCESQLPSPKYGKVAHDVEHFRPKGRVKPWPGQQELELLGVTFTKTPRSQKGYYLLPFNIFNYATSCKVCNSIMKKDYFPIAGKYKLSGANPRRLSSELPYLVYPIGDLDADPEDLIAFNGVTPIPKAMHKSHDWKRALVSIEFFKLADASGRSDLFSERAKVILSLYLLLNASATGSKAERLYADSKIRTYLRPSLAHYSCAKHFKILFDKSPSDAKMVYDAAYRFISSVS